jgi:ATP-binding cassette subfamily B protein
MQSLMLRWRHRRHLRHLVHQHDAADCGAAALLSVLRMLGGSTTLERVRQLAGTNAVGTSMFGLASAATKLGLEASAVRGSFEQLCDQQLPLIAHIATPEGLAHFVVLLEVSAKGAYIADPAGRSYWLSRPEFEKQWLGAVLLLSHGPAALAQEPGQDVGRWLLAHLNDHRTWITQSVFTGCVYAALGIASAMLLQVLVDKVLPHNSASQVLVLALAFAVVGVIRTLVGFTRQHFAATLSRRAGDALARSFISRLFRLELHYFASRRNGDISSRLKDVMSVNASLVGNLGEILIDVVIVAACLAALSRNSPEIAIATCVVLLCLGLFLAIALAGLARHQRRAVSAFASAETALLDGVAGVHAVKTYGLAGHAEKRVLSSMDTFLEQTFSLRRRAAAVGAVAELANVALLTFALYFSSLQVLAGESKLGALMAMYALLGLAMPSVVKAAQSLVSVQAGWISAARIVEALGASPEPTQATADCEAPATLSVEQGLLRYPDGRDLLAVPHFQLSIGELVHLRGANGSGKSTFARMLQRMWPLATGKYTVAGVPVDELTLDSLRRRIVVLHKDSHLFPGSIAQNLLLHLPPEQHQVAIEQLARNGVLEMLAQAGVSLAEHVGEGERALSAGERQLVGLGRALAAQPAFLVLDEALGALDSRRRARAMAIVAAYATEHAVLVIDHDYEVLAGATRSYDIGSDRILVEAEATSPQMAVHATQRTGT